jgi:SET family sugar efflux transporter-like MFS transporter
MGLFLQRCRVLLAQPGIISLLWLSFVLGLAYSFVAPFMSMFGTLEVHMTPMVFGAFMTVTTVASILIGTVLAHYSDSHFTRRGLLLAGSASGALGYLGFAFLRDLASLLIVGSLVLGVSAITFSQLFAHAREMILRTSIPKADVPFHTNVFRMFFALAWTVGPAIGAWVMIAFSFRGLFLCAAGTFLLFMAGVWLYVPAGLPAGPSPGPGPAAGAGPRSERILKVLARRDLLAHFVGFVAIFTAGTICMNNVPLFVLGDLKGNEHQIGIIYCVAPVFELPFMLYFGMLATRRSAAGIIRIGLVISVLYYGLLAWVRAPWQIYPLQVLSAATTAVTAGVAISYFQGFMPGRAGTATNLYASAQRLGSTLGFLLFGVLVWRFGYRGVFVACMLFAVGSLGLMNVSPPADDAVQEDPSGELEGIRPEEGSPSL